MVYSETPMHLTLSLRRSEFVFFIRFVSLPFHSFVIFFSIRSHGWRSGVAVAEAARLYVYVVVSYTNCDWTFALNALDQRIHEFNAFIAVGIDLVAFCGAHYYDFLKREIRQVCKRRKKKRRNEFCQGQTPVVGPSVIWTIHTMIHELNVFGLWRGDTTTPNANYLNFHFASFQLNRKFFVLMHFQWMHIGEWNGRTRWWPWHLYASNLNSNWNQNVMHANWCFRPIKLTIVHSHTPHSSFIFEYTIWIVHIEWSMFVCVCVCWWWPNDSLDNL